MIHRTAFALADSRSFRQAALAIGLLAASAAAQAALSSFTLDPSAVGLAGASPFTADNLLISDYATVTNDPGPGHGFTETGFLSISGAQLNGHTLSPTGLNTSYGLYISFTGAGTGDGKNPLTDFTSGTFTSLDYTLWGYNGTAAFGFSGTTPTTTAAGSIPLASGKLVSGSAYTVPNGTSFFPGANATVTFDTLAAAFFDAPSPYFNQALTSFTNTPLQVEQFANGFMINSGGGSINFTTAVPEPSSYALLLAGLAAVGWVAGRRGRNNSA